MNEYVIGFLLGFFTNLLTAFIFEKFRNPNLKIDVGSKTPSHRLPHSSSVNYSFLHLNVTNINRLGLTNPALSVKAKIIFKNLKNNKELFSVDGRWSGNPEPFIPMNVRGTEGRVNPTVFPLLRKIDILPGEAQELDVAIKYDDDPAVYAFSNESYIPLTRLWRNDNWKIDFKKVLVDVTVSSGSLKVNEQFILKNPSKVIAGVVLKNFC